MNTTNSLPPTTLTGQAPTYSREMADRFLAACQREIDRIEARARDEVAQVRRLMAHIEQNVGLPVATQGGLPVGRDPYAGAPAWADQADQRVERLMSLPDDGGGEGD